MVTVTVTDKNGNGKTASFTLQVNARPTVTVDPALADKPCTQGAACSYAPITVALGTAPLTVSVTPQLPTGLTATISAGRVTIAGLPTGAVQNTTYTLTVTDAAGATNTATFTLTVNSALVLTPGDTAYQCTTGAACQAVPATAAGGSRPLVYTIAPALPAPLALNAATGAISGTPATALPRTVFRVAVTDAASATASRDFPLTINAPVTATVASPVVASTLNHPFAIAFPTGIRPVTGSGGTGALVYTITPALRANLAFDAATGAITGMPTVAGSSAHTVRVTDSRGAFAEAPFTLAIAPALSATALAPRVCTQGAACTFTPLTATGGTGALSYVIITPPALPTGLMLVGASGVVTGTPSGSTGAVLYTMRVVDVVGAAVTQTFTLTVNPPLVATLNASAYACTVAAPCAFTAVTASAGTSPYGFSISPALPGLSFSATTGAVSGTAAGVSAVTSYAITVTDAAGATASRTFTFGVNGPITAIVATPAVISTAGVSFATAFPAGMRPVQGGGGAGTLTYTVTPPLPSGFAFAPQTGAITGTPLTGSATATYTVTITDQAAASLSRTFTLTINPPLAETVVVPAVQCIQNVPCSATPVTATGGTSPRTWSVSPALPTGLSFSSTGAISGTPNNVQPATPYTVTVRDAVGATAIASFTLTVNASGCSTFAQTLSFLVSGTITAGSCAWYGSGLTDAYRVTLSSTTVVELRAASSAFGTIAADAIPVGATSAVFYSSTAGSASGHYLLSVGPWLLRAVSNTGALGAYSFSATVRAEDVDACRNAVIQTMVATTQQLTTNSCSQTYSDGIVRYYDEFDVWIPGRACTIDMRAFGTGASLQDSYLEAWLSDYSATFAVNDDTPGSLDSRIQLANCTDPNGNIIRLRTRAFDPSDTGLYVLSVTVSGASSDRPANDAACAAARAQAATQRKIVATSGKTQVGGAVETVCGRAPKR